MDESRRRLLTGCGTIFVFLGGCANTTPESSHRTDSDRGNTTGTNADYADTILVTTTVERKEVEYFPESDSVRYVAAYRSVGDSEDAPPEREPVYETISFDEWAKTECAHEGAKAVQSAMKRRLGSADGIVAGVTHESGQLIISLSHQTMVDRDRDAVSKPTVAYEQVKRAAPTRVRATISLSGRKHSCVVPVKTQKTTIQWQ